MKRILKQPFHLARTMQDMNNSQHTPAPLNPVEKEMVLKTCYLHRAKIAHGSPA